MNLKKRLTLLEAKKKAPARSSEHQLLFDTLPLLSENELDEIERIFTVTGVEWIEDLQETEQKRLMDLLTGAIARGQRHGIGFKVE